MQVQIRLATLASLESIAQLFDQYRQFYGQQSDLGNARRFLQNRMEKGESHLFLAEVDGCGVGFTQLYPSFSSVSMKRLWILNDLFVAPAFRKQGVAKLLLEAAMAFSQRTEAKGLTLSTAHDNLSAQALYQQSGFRREEKFQQWNWYQNT